MKNKISFNDAVKLSSILGKCSIKELGNELFIPIIKAKSNLSAVVKKYGELETSVLKELGFENGIVPNGTSMETLQSFSKTQRELSEHLADVENLLLFTPENLLKLNIENPTLTTSELEIIYDLMVNK